MRACPSWKPSGRCARTWDGNNVCYVHLTLLPYITGAEELKTKPTQHSVKELRSIGIQPDALICRSDVSISDSIREKLSLFCDVDGERSYPCRRWTTSMRCP